MMFGIDKFGIKLLFYFAGMALMSFGVVVSVISDLGVTPISSIPYTITVVSGMDFGVATMIFSVLMVLLQILILRKNYKIVNLLQLPIGLVFGAFLTFCGLITAGIPTPDSFVLKIFLILLSTVFVAAGVFLYVSPGFVPLPPEGFVIAVSQALRKKFSTVKVISDVTMVLISLLTCVIIVHSLGSVGVGTIIAAVLVGYEVKLLTKFFGAKRDRILGRAGIR
ncbi:MAG TPA: DUF6198 family protein [Methanocorpusculum sp.]|jgi:uncharacterized membrane protein YczE|nr:DUF6198 family protein [Methanocorpusculum sp.]